MRTPRVFMASLVVALVVLSVVADRGAPQGVVTGTVTAFQAGEEISIVRYRDDPGFSIALRQRTAYKGDPAVITPGVRVTVWYRSVGERLFVADEVRVLADAAH